MVLLGCSRGSDDVTTTDTTPVLETSHVITGSSGTYTSTFKYSGDKILEENGSDGYKIVYTYDGDYINTETEYDASGKKVYASSYYYANGKLISDVTVSYYSGTSSTTTTNYNWIDDNHAQTKIPRVTGTYNYIDTHDYYFSNGNLINETDSYSYGIYSNNYTLTYQYDSNNSAGKNVRGLNKLISYNGGEGADNNNVTSIVYTYQQKTNGIITFSINRNETYIYEYNANKYPTKAVYNYQETGSIGNLNRSEQHTFAYNK